MCVYMRFGYRASRPHGYSPKGSSVGERPSGKGVHPHSRRAVTRRGCPAQGRRPQRKAGARSAPPILPAQAKSLHPERGRTRGRPAGTPRAEARSGVKSLPAGGAAYPPRTGRACADRRERRCTSRGAIKHNAQLCQRQRGAVRGVCRSPGITAIMLI